MPWTILRGLDLYKWWLHLLAPVRTVLPCLQLSVLILRQSAGNLSDRIVITVSVAIRLFA